MPPKRAVSKSVLAKKRQTFAEKAADEASKTVESIPVAANKKRVTFTSDRPASAAATKGSGIVRVAKATKRKRTQTEDIVAEDASSENGKVGEAPADEVEVDDDAATLTDDSGSYTGDDIEDRLSDLADEESSAEDGEDEDGEPNQFVRARRDGTPLAYPALRLRFLPAEFQEPQLFKFLGQFGAKVLNCFCVRSRRTHQSKGIAYVQFDDASVLPLVVEECHGMSLGGRAVQAKQVILHRAMPSKEKASRRRGLAYMYKTKGAPLQHYNVAHKSSVALLIKAAQTEQQNNDHLKRLGIDFATNAFGEQLRNAPEHLFTTKAKTAVVRRILKGNVINQTPVGAAPKGKSVTTKKSSPASPKAVVATRRPHTGSTATAKKSTTRK